MQEYREQLTTPKELGDIIGMTLRRACIKESVTVRPIGFLLEDGGNMIHGNDYIVEDLLSVSASLAKAQFKTTESSELLIITCNFTNELKLSDINASSNGKVTLLSEDKTLLTSLSSETVKFSIAFRIGKGNYSNIENKKLLESNGYDSYVTISSRHTAVEAFSYEVVSKDNRDILNIKYTVNNDDSELVSKIISHMVNVFSSLG